MTEIAEVELSGESKNTRISLLIEYELLIFVGPTYFPYLLVTAVLAESIALVLGFVLFVVGLVMLIYLIRKKIIT